MFQSSSFWKSLIPFSLFFHYGFYSVDLFNHAPDKHTKDKYNTYDVISTMLEEIDPGISEMQHEPWQWLSLMTQSVNWILLPWQSASFAQSEGQAICIPSLTAESYYYYTSHFGFIFF